MAVRVSAVKLNRTAFNYAKSLVEEGKFVHDNRDMWIEHQPTAAQENAFIEQHGWSEFGKWHLGIDTDARENLKAHYKFPYGDFEKVHRCGVLAAESRAGQRKYADIEAAAAQLRGMIDQRA